MWAGEKGRQERQQRPGEGGAQVLQGWGALHSHLLEGLPARHQLPRASPAWAVGGWDLALGDLQVPALTVWLLGSDLLDEQDVGLQLLDGVRTQLLADEVEGVLWLQRQEHSESPLILTEEVSLFHIYCH